MAEFEEIIQDTKSLVNKAIFELEQLQKSNKRLEEVNKRILELTERIEKRLVVKDPCVLCDNESRPGLLLCHECAVKYDVHNLTGKRLRQI